MQRNSRLIPSLELIPPSPTGTSFSVPHINAIPGELDPSRLSPHNRRPSDTTKPRQHISREPDIEEEVDADDDVVSAFDSDDEDDVNNDDDTLVCHDTFDPSISTTLRIIRSSTRNPSLTSNKEPSDNPSRSPSPLPITSPLDHPASHLPPSPVPPRLHRRDTLNDFFNHGTASAPSSPGEWLPESVRTRLILRSVFREASILTNQIAANVASVSTLRHSYATRVVNALLLRAGSLEMCLMLGHQALMTGVKIGDREAVERANGSVDDMLRALFDVAESIARAAERTEMRGDIGKLAGFYLAIWNAHRCQFEVADVLLKRVAGLRTDYMESIMARNILERGVEEYMRWRYPGIGEPI